MLQLESFFSSSTLPWWFSEVCLSLQSGDGFPSGSCSQWNIPGPHRACSLKGFSALLLSHWQPMLSRSPVRDGKVQVGMKVAFFDKVRVSTPSLAPTGDD